MNEIIIAQPAAIAPSANSDDMLVQLFVATKRSEKTRVQYTHSTGMLRERMGKPLASITLQDAVD